MQSVSTFMKSIPLVRSASEIGVSMVIFNLLCAAALCNNWASPRAVLAWILFLLPLNACFVLLLKESLSRRAVWTTRRLAGIAPFDC